MKSWHLLVVGVLLVSALPVVGQPQLTKGQELLQRGEIAAALVELRQAAAKAPRNPVAWIWLGEAYLQAAKLDSAAFAAEKIIDLDGKAAAGYLLLSKVRLAEKNISEAVAVSRAGLKYNKQDHALLLQLGKALVVGDSSDQAIVAFTKAQSLAPNDPATYEALGDIYIKQGGTVVAIMQYEKALELDSLQANLQYKLAKACLKERRYNEAARAYQMVVKLDTTNQEAVFELAKLYFAAKWYDAAARLLPDYARRHPESKEAWAMYVEALYLSRQYKEVLTAAAKVLQAEPNSAKTLRVLAHAQFEMREYEQAIGTYQKLARQEKLSGDEVKRLGKAYVETKQDSLAALALEEALQQNPNAAEVYGDLGAIYMRLRQFDKAAAAFEKKFTLDSTSVSAYINYALSNMALQKWNLSRVALTHALRMKPDYLQGHLALARTLMQMDSLQQAKKVCEKIIKLAGAAPTNYKSELAEVHGYIGFVLLLDKKYPEAIEALTTSIRLIDSNPQTRLWRAQGWALAGKMEEAVAEYKVVLKLDPQNKEAKKNLAILTQ